MNFRNEMERTLGDEFNYSMTENGALGYRTTQSALLDLNFQVASLRNMSDREVANAFMKAFCENKILAVKWLFYLRDVRGGLGERKSFRTMLMHLASTHPDVVAKVVPIIAEYGRWDDVLQLANPELGLDKSIVEMIVTLVKSTLENDLQAMNNQKSCSLLAKWMPSAYSKNKEVRKAGQFWAKQLYSAIKDDNARERTYRKTLSALRKHLDIVECKMVAQDWDQINYEAVPSKANIVYRNAFMRHDEERRTAFLEAANNGEVKMNSSVAFPHDIVHQYGRRVYAADSALEALWKNLPNTVNDEGDNVLVVRDGSGSMTWHPVEGTQITSLTVATALAIYFAERITGQFKDSFITFSARPKFVDLANLNSLHDKLIKTYAEDDCSNTDIEAVFDLILTTAVRAQMPQEEMPSTILILSDMEFDASRHNFSARLFDSISKQYQAHGYKLPRLVFWNLNSRTGTIPVKENEMGVALVSGFSTNLAKMVMSNETDPYKVLVQTLESDRYRIIGELLQD